VGDVGHEMAMCEQADEVAAIVDDGKGVVPVRREGAGGRRQGEIGEQAWGPPPDEIGCMVWSPTSVLGL
jgi:hypothetical protein